MKSIFLMITCLLATMVTFSQSSIEGTWQPEGKEAIFKIFEKNGKHYGQLIGSTNPEEDKRIKRQEEIILLRNLEKNQIKNIAVGCFLHQRTKQSFLHR